MLTLFDNALSPFARKVRLALAFKALEVEVLDGLKLSNHERLKSANARLEVPTLLDAERDIVVVGSSDILAYLERVAPSPPLYPDDHAGFVCARAWERCADTVVDAILADISIWFWAKREDRMPEGMHAQACADMEAIYAAMERDLQGQEFLAGSLSCAELALFPHLGSVRMLKVNFDPERFPNVAAWFKRLRGMPLFSDDIMRAKTFMASMIRGAKGEDTHERRKIFWRGDRIEWVLARGHHDWFVKEIQKGRTLWPGLGVPGPVRRRMAP